MHHIHTIYISHFLNLKQKQKNQNFPFKSNIHLFIHSLISSSDSYFSSHIPCSKYFVISDRVAIPPVLNKAFGLFFDICLRSIFPVSILYVIPANFCNLDGSNGNNPQFLQADRIYFLLEP